ncbi:MAG: 3-oxoacyl-ACP reductase [Legionellales bacterium]|nr:3-oxoacyl-ACP reductase [Legionellales bacterium]OUX64718.1 MAG: hypothetical protein CBE41_02705 [Gammaproteobacteria bacterium TMED281]|tara:strand:+ start:1018 stop:1755 length:738 start_codon:yes stop_codon:yes gene_type:complete
MKKIAFVSGGSRGIGFAILKEMLSNNYITIATSTTNKGADLISETIASHQGEGLALVGDLKDGASTVKKWENEILKEFQTLPDILIANAGITKDQLTIRMTEEQWEDVLKVNLTSSFLLSQTFIKAMMKKKWGRIIFLGSVTAFGNPGQINYSASKAALSGVARTIALEYGSRNITANVVSPGFIETDMTHKLSEKQIEAIQSKIPLKRYGQVEEVANLISFLASEKANYITGQTIHINGGMLTT